MNDVQPSTLQLQNAQGEYYLTITKRDNYMYAKWKGHINADEVISAAKMYLEYIKERPCSKLLNDKSEASGDWQDANDWLEFDWLPKAYAVGLRCLAHIYSKSMFSQLSARDLKERVAPPLLMKNFTDFETAEEWLLRCKPSPHNLPV